MNLTRFLAGEAAEEDGFADGLPVDELSDEEAIGYLEGTLSGDEVARVEEQLRSSPELAQEMEWLRSQSSVWDGPTGQARLERLGRRLLWASLTPSEAWVALPQALQQLRESMSPQVSRLIPLGAAAAGGDVMASGDSPGGLLRWEVRRTDDDSLTIGVWSSARSLAGRALRISVGDWRNECVLTRRGLDDVAAEVLIGRETRAMFGIGGDVSVSLEAVEPTHPTAKQRSVEVTDE